MKMSLGSMPSHERVMAFAERIRMRLPGYDVLGERADSRVVVLTRDSSRARIR
jgi:wyosine [tRNA(Phe)-imidazoG37] synthetase (radical SAM superfamily)